MDLMTTNTQNYDFLFSNREMSPAEKSVRAKQSFLDAVRQTGGNEKAEPSKREKMANVQETLQKIKNKYKTADCSAACFFVVDNSDRRESNC